MKKVHIFSLIFFMFFLSTSTYAEKINTSNVEPPKWEDYLPEKYHNPRGDFKRKTAYGEMALGFILTDFIITAPIGIPLLVHSGSKIKHLSNYEKKKKFERGLVFAESIKDPKLKEEYYQTLIKDCKLSERKKNRLAKKKEKEKLKELKKKQKEQEKQSKENLVNN